MAWIQTDLDAIDAAILGFVLSGANLVRFADGREVKYHTLPELLQARDVVRAAVTGAAGGIRCTVATFRKD